jgi:hypothetical protein
MSDRSDRLRQIAAVDGHGYRIGKAIDWLKTNIASPLRVEELASRVQMSTLLPPPFQTACGNESAPLSEMAASQ